MLSTPDALAAWTARIGAAQSAIGTAVPYPLGASERASVDTALAEADGALVVVTLEPRKPLAELSQDDAAALGAELSSHAAGQRIAVRFAPDMNGTWTSWGLQPKQYIAAFRQVAESVHASVPGAAMLWSPAYGAGYPFASAKGALAGIAPETVALLDTDRNGTVGESDAPYAPYYPGDDAVDWVGLEPLHYGEFRGTGAQTLVPNTVPAPDAFAGHLVGTYGYSSPASADRDFVARYSTGKDKPLVLVTGALFVPQAGGATEAAVKGAWLDQVAAGTGPGRLPLLKAVLWQEAERPEAEAGGRLADWRLSTVPALAAKVRALMTGPGQVWEAGPSRAAAAPVSAGPAPAGPASAQAAPPGRPSAAGSPAASGGPAVPDWVWIAGTVAALAGGVYFAQHPLGSRSRKGERDRVRR
jgi:hypothetical protein